MNNIDAFTRRQGDGWTRRVLFPKKGTSYYRDMHRLIVTVCCSHKLLNFAPYMKETSLFWLQTCHAFLLFGVEAGVMDWTTT